MEIKYAIDYNTAKMYKTYITGILKFLHNSVFGCRQTPLTTVIFIIGELCPLVACWCLDLYKSEPLTTILQFITYFTIIYAHL